MQHDTTIDAQPRIYAHSDAHYSAQEIAAAHGVAESTVRTRWYDWIKRVAPGELLKTDFGFTELARTLFAEFSKVDKRERVAWVADAKSRYSSEWSSAGIIEGELMPDNVGNVLAIIQTNNNSLQQQLNNSSQSGEYLVDQLNQADANFSEAELNSFRAAGMQRALVRYQVETQTEAEVLNALRERRLKGSQNAQQ